MDAGDDKVRCLWVPLREINLLLPNMAVAEIGSYHVPRPLAGKPEWLLGMVDWRGGEIPVISIEAVCGVPLKSNPVFSRLMVVNSVRQASSVAHYAIITAGLPGLIQFGAETASRTEGCALEAVECMVRIGEQEAIIPDLDFLQGMLEQELANAA